MKTTVEYFSEWREPFPAWLEKGDYSLRNFFGSRTVFYPAAGADGRPMDIFNRSHSAHCYFFVDQGYSATCLDKHTGDPPTGYAVISDKQYSADELKRESVQPLPERKLQQFSTPPRERVVYSTRDYRSQDSSSLAAVDSDSAVRLRIYERQPSYGETHGASRFAIFCLGMEARTAYEWFYGIMFKGHPPFVVWIQEQGFIADFAKNTAQDMGFGDSNGRICQASIASGLPDFLIVKDTNRYWHGYPWIEGVAHRPGSYGHRPHKRSPGAARRLRRMIRANWDR